MRIRRDQCIFLCTVNIDKSYSVAAAFRALFLPFRIVPLRLHWTTHWLVECFFGVLRKTSSGRDPPFTMPDSNR